MFKSEDEIRRLSSRLRTYAMNRGMNRDTAEDFSQFALLYLWEITCKKGEEPKLYLNSLLVEYMRSEHGRPKVKGQNGGRHAVNAAVHLGQDADRLGQADISGLVDVPKMEPFARSCFTLVAKYDFLFEEVADVFQLSPSRLTQILRKTRKKLGGIR